MIDTRLVVHRDGFTLDVALSAAAGEVVALLGPNGAGKTTALRALAGLTPLAAGHVRVDGERWEHRPAERRPVGMVFQDYLLFPHLSALENVAFGPRCHGAGRAEARRTAAEWLRRVGLADHAARKPRALSGGQAQRVALARALAVRPRLLLLDEPLSALDAHTRPRVRAQLRRHLADFDGAVVLVTHDPLDAMALADRIVVIEAGRVVQEGDPAYVARHPRTEYVARLVGLNLYRGTARGHAVTLGADAASRAALSRNPPGDTAGATVRAGMDAGAGAGAGRGGAHGGTGAAPGPPAGITLNVTESLDGDVFVAFPPSAVAVFRTRPDGSPRNLWRATIAGVEPYGDQVRVHLDGPVPAVADVTPGALAELRLAEGDAVWVAVKAAETHAYPA